MDEPTSNNDNTYLLTQVSNVKTIVNNHSVMLDTVIAEQSAMKSTLSNDIEGVKDLVGLNSSAITKESVERINADLVLDGRISNLSAMQAIDKAYLIGEIEAHHADHVDAISTLASEILSELNESQSSIESVTNQLSNAQQSSEYKLSVALQKYDALSEAFDFRTADSDLSTDSDDTITWSILSEAHSWELALHDVTSKLEQGIDRKIRDIEATVIQASEDASVALSNTDVSRLVDKLQGQVGIDALDDVLWNKLDGMANDIHTQAIVRVQRENEIYLSLVDQILENASTQSDALLAEVTKLTDSISVQTQRTAEYIADETEQRANAIADSARQTNATLAEQALQQAKAIEDEAIARALAIEQQAQDLIAKITESANSSLKALEDRASELSTDYAARIEQLRADYITADGLLSDAIADGITQYQTVADDIISKLDTYKVSNDLSVAGIQEQLTILVSDTTSMATDVTALASRVDANVADIVSLTKTVADEKSSTATQLDTLNTATADNKSSIADVAESVTSLDSATATKFSELNTALNTTNTNLGTTNTAVAKAQSTADTAVNTNKSQATDITSLKTRMTTNESGLATKAASSTVSALDSKVTTQGNTITSQGESITTINNTIDTVKADVATKASTDALNAVISNVESIDGIVTAHTGSLSTLEAKLNTVDTKTGTATANAAKAQQTADSAVTANSALSQRIDTLTAQLTDLGEGAETNVDVTAFNVLAAEVKAQGGNISTLNTDTSTLRSDLDTVTTNLNGLETTVSGNTEAINALQTTQTAQGSSITQTASDVTKLKTDLTTAQNSITTKATTSALNATNTKVTGIDGRVTTNTTNITNLTNRVTTTEGDIAKKADASALDSTNATVADINGQVTSHTSSIQELSGEIEEVSADASKALDNAAKAQTTADTAVTSNSTTANRVTTLEGRTTTIESGLAKKAEASALTSYYTKTEADSVIAGKVDAYDATLSIGGVNLLPATNWKSISDLGNGFIWGNLGSSSTLYSSDVHQAKGIRLNSKAGTGAFGYVTPAELRTSKIVEGRKYTLSFVGQGTFNQLNYVYIIRASTEGSNFVTTGIPFGSGGNKRRSVTFTAPWSSATVGVLIAANRTWVVGDWLSIGDLQLEEGTKATVWSPSIAEVDKSLDANASAISATNTEVSRINGVVTSHTSSITSINATLTATGKTADTALANAAKAQTTADTAVTDGKANATKISTVETSLNEYKTSNDTALATANTKITDVQTASNTADTALGSRIDNLTTTVTNNNTSVTGQIKTVADSVTSLEGSTNTKVSKLESSMTTANTNIANTNKALDTTNANLATTNANLATTNTNLTNTTKTVTANTKAIDATNTEVTRVNGVVVAQGSSITDLSTSVSGLTTASNEYRLSIESLAQESGATNSKLESLASANFAGDTSGNAGDTRSQAGYESLLTTVANQGVVQAERIDKLSADLTTLESEITSSIVDVNKVITDSNSTTSAKLTQMESSIKTTVDDVIAPLSAKLTSEYYTKADIDNTVIAGKLEQYSSTVTKQIGDAIADIDLDTASQIVIPDTRSTNELPSWYRIKYARSVVTEFKSAVTIGLTAALMGGSYVTMVTYVGWTDSSGGYIKQVANGATEDLVYVRYSTGAKGAETWGPWVKVGTAQSQAFNVTLTEQANVVDGIRGIKTITIDNNGVLSGYGLVSDIVDGKVTSAFGVNADQFYVGSPATGKKVFSVVGNTTVINDAVIGTLSADKITTGTMHGDRITAGTLNATHIASNSITADKLQVTDLSAISANLGSIKVGSANIGALAVDSLHIADRAVTTSMSITSAMNYDLSSGKSLRAGATAYMEMSTAVPGFNTITNGNNCILFIQSDLLIQGRSVDAAGTATAEAFPYTSLTCDVTLNDVWIATLRSFPYYGGLATQWISVGTEGSTATVEVSTPVEVGQISSLGSLMLPFVMPSGVVDTNPVLKFKITGAPVNSGISYKRVTAKATSASIYLVEFKK